MGVLSGKQAPLRDQAVMAGNVKAQADLWPDRGRGPALSLPQEMCGYSHKELAAVCPDSRFWYLPGEANVPAMLKNSVSFPHARVSLALLALARDRWYQTQDSWDGRCAKAGSLLKNSPTKLNSKQEDTPSSRRSNLSQAVREKPLLPPQTS
jgi:hypothetical protein